MSSYVVWGIVCVLMTISFITSGNSRFIWIPLGILVLTLILGYKAWLKKKTLEQEETERKREVRERAAGIAIEAEQAAREEKAIEMLDNIQRHRKRLM